MFRSALLVVLLCGVRAYAQACCVSTSALFPARLGGSEIAGVGVMLTARDVYGSFNGTGHFVAASSRTLEADFEQRMLAVVQPVRGLQVGVALPFVETVRSLQSTTEAGGGVGDVSLSARYDILYAGNAWKVPGIAVVGAVTAPTGVAVDAGHSLLGTDATGQGVWQGALGVALEYDVGENIVLELVGQVTGRLARRAEGVDEQLAPQGSIAAAAAYVFESQRILALLVTFIFEGNAWIDGTSVANSGRRLTALGAFGSMPLPDDFSLQGTVTADLPISQLGQGQPVGVTLTAAVIKRW